MPSHHAPDAPPTPARRFASLPLHDLLAQLAAKSPAPGGGAAASTTGATSAALARMVVAYSLNKKALAEHQPTLEAADLALARFVEIMLALADEDAAAYALLNELQRLPETDPRRVAELPTASAAALAAPRATLAAACDLLRLIESLGGKTNHHLRSDLAIAAILAEAAARSARWNVLVNLALATDDAARAEIAAESRAALLAAADRCARVERACE